MEKEREETVMLTAVRGTYKNGRVELAETPPGIDESEVIVTFVEAKPKPKGQMIRRGMFPELLALTDEDFKAAEFHGDPDDGLDWS